MLLDERIWRQRWQALDETMRAIDRTLPSDIPKRQAIQSLLEGLRALAAEQVDYFLAEPPPAAYSSEYALSLTLQQVSHDIEAIERAAHQRIASAPEMREALDKADELAFQSLKPAIGRYLPAMTTLTYFQKSPGIRTLPYSFVALLGIPFTCACFAAEGNVSRDYLAIPHEAGHYLFWRGVVPEGEAQGLRFCHALRRLLQVRAPGFPETAYQWAEEIFADVYACLIAGPVLALDFQDLQFHHPPIAFMADDGRHPPPILRPEIHFQALRRMGLAGWADSLRERWQEHLARRLELFKTPGFSQPTTLLARTSLRRMRIELQTVVEASCDLLTGLHPDPENWWATVFPASAPFAPNKLESLYDHFAQKVDGLQVLRQETDYLKLEGGETGATPKPKGQHSRFAGEEWRPRAPGNVETGWLTALRAGGWTHGR